MSTVIAVCKRGHPQTPENRYFYTRKNGRSDSWCKLCPPMRKAERLAATTKVCAVPGCTRKAVYAVCRLHYIRMYRTGTYDSRPQRLACRVEGCERLGTLKLDMCGLHLRRLRDTGTLEARVNEAAIFCDHGHEWTVESTGRFKTGARYCKRCNNDRQKAYQLAHPEKVAAYKQKRLEKA
jgi:hypothetical protein